MSSSTPSEEEAKSNLNSPMSTGRELKKVRKKE